MLSFPAPSKHVAILFIVFKTEPLSQFVEFLVLTDVPGVAFLKVWLVEVLVGVFTSLVGFDCVTDEATEVLRTVTRSATFAVTTGPRALMTSLSVAMKEGSIGM